jgi:pyruvate formate lyase activating enzyme
LKTDPDKNRKSGLPVERVAESPCVREAILYERLEGSVRCKTCEHLCEIQPGKRGICGTRVNIDGTLYTLEYGDVGSFIAANPIEKKPFFHFYPGSYALTAGSWSCNFLCPWCQNWHMSKSLPDPLNCRYVSPEEFVSMVGRYGCQGTSMSFNEPTLLLEYSIEVFRLAKDRGYYNTFVTNGYMSSEALRLLRGSGLDAANIDIKGDGEAVRKFCGADVEKVWRNAVEAKRLGVWVEITTLIIPRLNDDDECLRGIARRVKSDLNDDTPWHVTQYCPAYRAVEVGLYRGRTPVQTLEKAWRIGREEGLKYVYIGNVPGHRYENTYCPRCGELLIERFGFEVVRYRIAPERKCPRCGEEIPIIGSFLMR